MIAIKIIEDRLASYDCKSQQEEELAIKEITQELILMSLYSNGFFKKAAFQGGTCLRIFYGLNRFSEDLDFALIKQDKKFNITIFLKNLNSELKSYGYDIQMMDRPAKTVSVASIFLKDDSIGKIINIKYPQKKGPAKTLKIKIEIDTLPPKGATLETKFHNFPLFFSVTTHDLSSLFAGKSHALLVRKYIKGRDWYDFLWYVSRQITPNFKFLSHALNQNGPWAGKKIKIDMSFYQKMMKERIVSIDWKAAKKDIERFLKPSDLKTLELWNTDFFLSVLKRLETNPN